MAMQLMPYGSSLHAALVAKVGTTKSPAHLLPYGSADHAALAAKVGTTKSDDGEAGTRRVVRRNAR